MSEPIDNESIDDRSFQEYLDRESQLSKRYRALDAEEVPAELDRLVLAQAHRAVAARRPRPTWLRWAPPLSLAASVVLVIAIVFESGTQHEVTMRDVAADLPPPAAPAQSSMPAAAPPADVSPGAEIAAAGNGGDAADSAGDAARNDLAGGDPTEKKALARRQLAKIEHKALAIPSAPQAQPAEKAAQSAAMEARLESAQAFMRPRAAASPPEPVAGVQAPAASDSQAEEATIAAEMPPPAPRIEVPPAVQTAVSAASAAAPPATKPDGVEADLQEIQVTANPAQRPAARSAGPRGTITVPPPAAAAQTSDEALPQAVRESDPERWLQYIRELRRENKGAEADREWRNFLKAYPGHAVNEKDVARPKR